MAAGDVYKLTLSCTGLGSTYQNVLAFRTLPATDPSQAQWQALADDWLTVAKANAMPSFGFNNWRSVQVFGAGVTYGPEDCKRHGGNLFTGNFTAPTGGTNGGTGVLPPQNATVVTISSGLIGRRKRGRIYLFGASETDQDSGSWTGTYISGFNGRFTTWFNKYKASGTDPNFQLGIWSEREATGCIWDPITKAHKKVDDGHPDQAFTPVSGFQTRTIVYNQRRRTLGVGR
jgi:hypothetical protein